MVMNININLIGPNPNQPRKAFDGIEALAESMKAEGQLTPILVRPVGGAL